MIIAIMQTKMQEMRNLGINVPKFFHFTGHKITLKDDCYYYCYGWGGADVRL